ARCRRSASNGPPATRRSHRALCRQLGAANSPLLQSTPAMDARFGERPDPDTLVVLANLRGEDVVILVAGISENDVLAGDGFAEGPRHFDGSGLAAERQRFRHLPRRRLPHRQRRRRLSDGDLYVLLEPPLDILNAL